MALMFLSGAAALAYEIIWMRMLSRAFGVTVHAVAVVVALYMAGLALGAYGGPRLNWRGSWLRLYAWLEAGAGLTALLGTWWMLRLPAVVAAWSADRPLPALPRLLLAAPALLPAACLLGATLPALTRHCGAAGKLYAANTLGAMSGLAVVSFWAVGTWGETSAIILAVVLNAIAALAAAVLSRGAGWEPAPGRPMRANTIPDGTPGRPGLVLGLFAVSGFCALGYEILWSRQLVLLLGNSTYAFAMLLMVYLGGIGLGSLLTVDPGENVSQAFAALLSALGCAAVLSAAAYRFMGLGIDSAEFLYSPLRRFSDFPLIYMEAVVIILPVALMLGLLFPIAVRFYSRSCDEATAVGRLYAWNTAGGIAGSLWAGFVGVSRLGTHNSFLLLAGLQTAAGLAAAAWLARGRRRWLVPAVFAACSLCVLPYVRRDPTLDIIGNRLKQAGQDGFHVLFHDESAAATITGLAWGKRQDLYINGIETSGKGWAGTWMALLPNLLVDNIRSSLVICLGAGNTLRAAGAIDKEVDGVELIADVARRIPVFQSDSGLPRGGVKPRLFIEDGRNYLLRARRRYDVIIVDAAPPLYSAGAVNLYTKEFMELARRRLEDGGIFTLWLPTKSFESDYWQVLRGMSDVFEHVAVWDNGTLTGLLLLGSSRPFAWPPGLIERRIRERTRAFELKGLHEPYVRSGLILSERDIRNRVRRFRPVTDDHPAVEFPLARFWRGEALQQDTSFLMKARRP
jgi:spermidine synthase